MPLIHSVKSSNLDSISSHELIHHPLSVMLPPNFEWSNLSGMSLVLLHQTLSYVYLR